jgi:hypothetical protein
MELAVRCDGCSEPAVSEGPYNMALCEFCSVCDRCFDPTPNDDMMSARNGESLCRCCWDM